MKQEVPRSYLMSMTNEISLAPNRLRPLKIAITKRNSDFAIRGVIERNHTMIKLA
jgi:hypothetical protein